MLYNYIVTLILGWMVVLHPFYISVTDVNYNPKTGSLEVAQKIFWDDLEVALGNKAGKTLDFLNPDAPEELEKLIKDYFLEKNAFTVNGQAVSLDYIGYEIEEDAAWFYLEAKNVPKPKTVKVKNAVLISDFQDQQNMVNFYVGEKAKTLILYKDHEEGNLGF
ncbi:hypothetical protein GCM10028791_37090 [Echinicola sediminis]